MATPNDPPNHVGQYTSPILSLPYCIGMQLFEHSDGEPEGPLVDVPVLL
jgi:hypothetical protein